MGTLQRFCLLCPRLTNIQITRQKHGVWRHKKPRWIGPAPSKIFDIPIDHTPQDDVDQVLKLSWAHRERMSAISHYLFEDVRTQTGSGSVVAIERKKNLREKEKRLLEENEIENARIAQQRKLRLEREDIELEERIRDEVQGLEKEEEIRQRHVEDFIRVEADAIENRIKVEDLEGVISLALDNPVDNEFAIDTEGHVYRGRETNPEQISSRDLERIPKPLSEGEKLLKIKSSS